MEIYNINKIHNEKQICKMEIRIDDKNSNKMNIYNIKFTDKLTFVKETNSKTLWFKTANCNIDYYLNPYKCAVSYSNNVIEGIEQLVLFTIAKLPQNGKLCYIFCNKKGTKSYYFM